MFTTTYSKRNGAYERKSLPKKSGGILCEGNRLEAYRFIKQHHNEFGLRWLLRRFNICPNAYYNYRKHRKADRYARREKVLSKIADILRARRFFIQCCGQAFFLCFMRLLLVFHIDNHTTQSCFNSKFCTTLTSRFFHHMANMLFDCIFSNSEFSSNRRIRTSFRHNT